MIPGVGDIVINPKVPEWGPGRVLSVGNGEVRIFFLHAGERKLSLAYVTLTQAEGPEADSIILQNPDLDKFLKDKEFKSMPQALQDFRGLFPQGGVLGSCLTLVFL